MIALKRYADWRPSQFDTPGLKCPDQQDWYVGPCIRTRDSDALERANFDELIARLRKVGTEDEDFIIGEFGHWACGWFQIAIIRPDTKAAEIAETCRHKLADIYPCLSDDRWSEYEWNDASESWDAWQYRDVAKELGKVFGLSDRAVDLLCDHKDTLYSWCADNASAPCYLEDATFQWELTAPSREAVAALLRACRDEKRKGPVENG
jgi:hypothetical protein